MEANINQIETLTRQVQSLQKKLKRSEADRSLLEANNARTESLLKRVITDLRESKRTLEERSQALEKALQDLKATQTQLVESEKMSALGVLVAGVAHEINNPVSFIYGNLEHAEAYTEDLFKLIHAYQTEYPDPSEEIKTLLQEIDLEFLQQDYHQLLKSINIGAERIYEIVRSLRTFSRLDEAEYKVADLHEGLDSTLCILEHRLKPNATHNGIQLVRAYGELPKVTCYPGKLNQVFMNILVNAIDALESGMGQQALSTQETSTPEKPMLQPQITISTAFETNRVIIQITDNGPGIPADIIPKLFDPFFTTKPVGKGTGLGLSISYQIVVDQHQGHIGCQSSPQGGTTFTVVLPIFESKGHSALTTEN
jgi:two-component system NtrC family sensor kinase